MRGRKKIVLRQFHFVEEGGAYDDQGTRADLLETPGKEKKEQLALYLSKKGRGRKGDPLDGKKGTPLKFGSSAAMMSTSRRGEREKRYTRIS